MDAGTSSAAGRLSWEQAHRLEVALRTRAGRFARNGAPGRCPGCGRQIAPDDDHLKLAGVRVHTACACQEGTL